MSEQAQYRFFPWIRSGFVPGVTEPAALEPIADPSHLGVELELEGSDDSGPVSSETATVDLRLYGPGDVTGISPSQVVRTEPTAGAAGVVPTDFPFVEFDRPDLPWLFSPTSATEAGKLRPWCCLVVVEARDGVRVDMDPERPLPTLSIAGPASPSEELPDLTDSWAWAHAQVVGAPSEIYDDAWLARELGRESDATVSRLLAPRRLHPDTTYHACVVPTFEAGRLTGLGDEIEDGPLEPAWRLDALGGSIALPVYHHWQFSTGLAGDFESLVRRLTARPIPPSVGSRPLDVGNPGNDDVAYTPDPDADEEPLVLVGPLQSPGTERATYPDPQAAALRDLLHIAGAGETPSSPDPDPEPPALGPPIYGQWHAPARTAPTTDDNWVAELNADPQGRALSGLGTDTIQTHQESFMASAWAQLGDVRRANRLLRQGQFSRGAATGLYDRLAQFGDADLVSLTAPVHATLAEDGETVAHRLDGTRVTRGARSPTLRRLCRPAGPLGRRFADGSGLDVGNLLSGLDEGRLDVGGAGPPGPESDPDGIATLRDASAALCQAATLRTNLVGGVEDYQAAVQTALETRREELQSLGIGGTVGDIDIDVSGDDTVTVDVVAVPAISPTAGTADGYTVSVGDGTISFTIPLASEDDEDGDRPETTERASTMVLRFTTGGSPVVPTEPTDPTDPSSPTDPTDPGDPSQPPDETPRERRDRLEAELELLEDELVTVATGETPTETADVVTDLACGPLDAAVAALPSADLATTATELTEALDPETTVPARVLDRIDAPGDLADRDDPLAPLLAIPEFDRPMYELLRDRSQELLLPGVGEIQPDTIGLLETNPAFVEAYMVGLNHEMAREFLWREYPTVNYGTYFRQFWDPSGRVPPPENEDAARDIDPIRSWSGGPLGSNMAGGTDGTVVLAIRGDLFERYPTASVYAVKATEERNADGDLERVPVPDPTAEGDDPTARYPQFRGTLDPDLTFFGFELSVDDAREADGLGWFFVIEETPGEPRFGLDVADEGDVGTTPNGILTSEPAPTRPDPETIAGSEVGWAALSWGHLVESGATRGDDPSAALDALIYVPVNSRPDRFRWKGETEPVAWGVNAAHMAYVTWQRPVRVAVHADDMLPETA